MLREFKKFAMRGNVVDLAVGVIIGAAFNGIVNSLVNDIIMPPLGFLTKRVDFANLYFNLSGGNYPDLAAAKAAGAVTINYGAFINNFINFLLVAFAVFLIIRYINKIKDKFDKDEEATTKECPFCVSVISVKAKKCPSCTTVLNI
jgi:large conductance mechanosensitive channel